MQHGYTVVYKRPRLTGVYAAVVIADSKIDAVNRLRDGATNGHNIVPVAVAISSSTGMRLYSVEQSEPTYVVGPPLESL